MNNAHSLSDWITHNFDHPVSDPACHLSFDAPTWEDTPEHNANFIADAFERSGELLSRFTDEQLNQGFRYLVSNSCSDFIFVLTEQAVPAASRLRALRSLFRFSSRSWRSGVRRIFPTSTSSQPIRSMGRVISGGTSFPIHGKPDEPERTEFDAEVLRVLPRLLSIPHDACRESALHGISEWHLYYPSVETIVDDWLARTSGLRPELVSYAERAKVGNVQ